MITRCSTSLLRRRDNKHRLYRTSFLRHRNRESFRVQLLRQNLQNSSNLVLKHQKKELEEFQREKLARKRFKSSIYIYIYKYTYVLPI